MRRLFKQYWRWLLALSLTALVLLGLFLPLPYYIESPGGAFDTVSAVTVAGEKTTDTEDAGYRFVTVSVSRATPIRLLLANLSPYEVVEEESNVTGGASQSDYMRINQYYMETSQNTAVYQAFTLAGRNVSLDYKGVYVLNVSDDSSFKDALHIADTVTAINGKSFSNTQELIDYVASLTKGDEVSVTYESNGKSQTATGKVITLQNGKSGIGIGLVDHTEVETDPKVTFSTDGIGGPSAGLMFTLSIYDRLTGNQLLKNRIVAGTGTIEADGSVGDVGGITQKVKAAADSGADIFFVPNNPVSDEAKKADANAKTNYQEAKETAEKLGTKMTIVPVTTAQEAIDYLKNHS